MKKKYLVCPNWVTSANDGDRHFITAIMLIGLYGVNPHECIVSRDVLNRRGLDISELIILRPKYNGDYRLPV